MCVSWCHCYSRQMTTIRFEELLKVQRWKAQDIHCNAGLVATEPKGSSMPALNPITKSVQSILPQITPLTQPLILKFPNHISFFRSLDATHSNSSLSTYPSKTTESTSPCFPFTYQSSATSWSSNASAVHFF